MGAPPANLKICPCWSWAVAPSDGSGRMWSSAATLQVDTFTGLPQPTPSQVASRTGAPPTNLKI